METTKQKNNRKLRPHRKRLWMFWQPRKRPANLKNLPNGWRLLVQTAKTLWRHKWLLLSITIVYAILNLILVRGFSEAQDVQTIKTSLDGVFQGKVPIITSTLGIVVYLAGSSSSTQASGSSSAYQVILAVVVSLAVIWSLRQITAGHKATFKQAYYQGMQPLVPFLLVLLLVAVQALPFVAAAAIYAVVISNGIAVVWYEYLVTFLVVGVLALWSLRMITSSSIALYIVTLPGMTPIKAIKSARELARFRRWSIIRKLLLLITVVALVGTIIMVPVIIFAAVAAPWVFYGLTMFILTILHTYLYGLYRELINHAPER